MIKVILGRRRALAVALACLGAALAVAACGSSSSGSGSGGSSSGEGSNAGSSGKKYSIYLDINGTFNGWRTQMQHIAQFASENPPLGEKVEYHFVDSSQELSGQTNDVNNIIASKPDALLLDSASAVGLNPEVQRACAAGIIVVSFDNVVTAPCAYKITLPMVENGEVLATYIGKLLKGNGEVVVDQAEVGATIADQLVEGELKAFKKFPGISVAAKMQSQFSPGLVKSQLAPILAAHPGVKAILLGAFMAPAIQALKAAHLKPVPLTAATTQNVDIAECTKEKIQCAAASVPPYLGAEAMKLALELLEGKADKSKRSVIINPPFLFTEPTSVPGFEDIKIEKTEPLPEVSGEATFPIAPPWLNISPQQAVSGS